jgi:CBS domain-containing protein
VVDAENRVSGVITRKQLHSLTQSAAPEDSLGEMLRQPVTAYPDEPLRVVAYRMAHTGFTRMPVIDGDSGKLLGMISLRDLVAARVRNLSEERHREQLLRVRLPFHSQSELGRETL